MDRNAPWNGLDPDPRPSLPLREDPERFFTEMFEQLRWHLVDRAREEALNRSRSYRNFRVGCAVLAWKHPRIPFISAGLKIYTGANLKPERDSVAVCAETFALQQAIEAQALLVAVVVTGDLQPDGETGHKTPTLHPCGKCRRYWATLSPGFHLRVPIMTTRLDRDDVFENHTIEQLITLHKAPVR